MEEMCRQQAEELELSRRAAAAAAESSVRRAEAEDEGQELLESLIASKVRTRLVNCFVASGVCCLRAAVTVVILCEVVPSLPRRNSAAQLPSFINLCLISTKLILY
jgi:hypothetical protein